MKHLPLLFVLTFVACGLQGKIFAQTRPSIFSGFAFRVGAVQTAPGLIIENTDKDTMGHLQQELDYGLTFGVFSMPNRDYWFNLFVHLDYFAFTMDRQLIANEKSKDLGTQVSGQTFEFVPGIALVLPFFEVSYLSLGLGYGVKFIDMGGDMYLTDGSVSVGCQAATASEDSELIKANCERYQFDKNIITSSLINTIDLKVGNFLVRYNLSNANASGDAENSPDKQSIDDHDFKVALTTLSVSYLLFF